MANNKHIPNMIMLPQTEIPRYWYNIQADMKELPPPHISPATGKAVTFEEMEAIFPAPIIEQEMSTERYIEIPEPVLAKYRQYRSTPLFRAYFLEEALGTPARIYYKYEGGNPSGSHKLNSALPQAYYNKISGRKKVVTETGAGQWGTALSIASQAFGLECAIYMVKISCTQKPYRRSMMQVFGADVVPSPSEFTAAGRAILAKHPDSNGSLGIAISEAVEVAAASPDTSYALGSVLNHVVLHQTIIGEEAKKQLESVGEYPDIIIGCNGGGSNFGGIAFPFLRDTLEGTRNAQFIAVESTACPKLTKGVYAFDYGDTVGMAPITKMYTLGHEFMPSGVHAGGLRYHGDNPLLSKLYHDGYVTATAIDQVETFDAALLFAKAESLLPAPESAHAIAQAIREANACKETGEEKVILINLSGNGYFDLFAYEQYREGKLTSMDETVNADIAQAQQNLPSVNL